MRRIPLNRKAAPSYLSQSKAEAILSEVRPTKMKSEVLVCINVFLDEFLWLVLSTARSFQTDRLKMSLLKALPTSLGKAAILEAEVELKAYWEKTGIAAMKSLENSPSPSATDFPLQPAFEVITDFWCGNIISNSNNYSFCVTNVKPIQLWAIWMKTLRRKLECKLEW